MMSFQMPTAKEANEFFEANGSDYRVRPNEKFTMADYVAIHEILIGKELDKRGYKCLTPIGKEFW